jgi:hypothetical protein
MSTPREILPGVAHWTRRHPGIGIEVSSYLLVEERVAVDPLLPDGGLERLAEAGAPVAVLLTCRHHARDAGRIHERFGCPILCPRTGLHELAGQGGVEPYDPGDELPGGGLALEVDALSPDESAILFARHDAVAFADGLVRIPPDAPIGFVPDDYMGDDPEGVRRGLAAAFRRILDEHRPAALLLAHGNPVVGDGAERMRAFLNSLP